eukprot:UN15010
MRRTLKMLKQNSEKCMQIPETKFSDESSSYLINNFFFSQTVCQYYDTVRSM